METPLTLQKEQEIIQKADNYVFALFKEKLSKKYVYHNYKHTSEVVNESNKLADNYQLPAPEKEVLLLAAWFHDTGYIDTYQGHEERSVEIATGFLQQEKYLPKQIQLVAGCIMATKAGQNAANLLEEILADADISNIGKDSFFANAELLRVEWELFLNQFYTDTKWARYQLEFLQSARFRTEAAQRKFAGQLAKNIQEQRAQLADNTKKAEKWKRETLAQPKRGIETMFHSTYSNHMTLSLIADNKANMMISLNAIIISVIITYLGAKASVTGPEFTRNPILMIPVGILLLTTLGSVVSAIMSAAPEVTSFKIRPHKIQSKRVNPLFFGSFTKCRSKLFRRAYTGLCARKMRCIATWLLIFIT